jgi:RNA polymerase sigma-70 factor (sigma-E family)
MVRPIDESFTVFVRSHSAMLLRLAYLLTQDHGHAEDVVQSALLKTYRRWSRLRAQDAAPAYARQAVVTTAASRWRLRTNQELVALPARSDASVEADSDRVGEQQAMRDLLRGLPPRMRAVLVLRYFEDLSEADTAAALGCTVPTVRTHTARGLARLRTALSPPATAATPLTARSL